MKLQFLGAAQTVTGSRSLVSVAGRNILVDCGLFQGFKYLRVKNRNPMPIDAKSIDAVILTHCHLDHSGYIPLLVKEGFKGPIYATSATRHLCEILLPDSGHLQEEEARYAAKHGYSKHEKPEPLYTAEDAKKSLQCFVSHEFGSALEIFKGVHFEFRPAGHLLGAASVLLSAEGKAIGFSGDIGRDNDPMIAPPHFDRTADSIVIESTYGNRKHLTDDPSTALEAVINRTVTRGGTVLIPSFAVGRAQLVLYYIHQLRLAGRIPSIPVYLNSPMAKSASDAFTKHHRELKVSGAELGDIFSGVRFVQSVEESIQLNDRKDPMILIAASGMATGGRILHHLKTFIGNEKCSVVFVGFQAGGTRGAALIAGADTVKIHGEYWPVRAEIVSIDSMSAHADGDGLIEWIRKLPRPPRRVFVNHGDPAAIDALRLRVKDELGLEALVPEIGDSFNL